MSEQDKKPRREFNEQRARHALHSCLDVETSEQADELPALKPCAHCAGQAATERTHVWNMFGEWRAYCTADCGATVQFLRTEAEAIAAWNRRAGDSK